MTIKTITTVEFGDIRSIEFECGTCHAKTTFPIEKFRHPIVMCNVCEPDKQLLIPGSEEFAEITSLGRIIQRLSKMERGRLVIRLEVTNVSASREVDARA